MANRMERGFSQQKVDHSGEDGRTGSALLGFDFTLLITLFYS